ncbi:MAG: VCBS repeat-containing protein, partial [Desulfobacteraceae bacterium]|nr:VCBS repeat-containing protein [Desulfobacteraceae bacterium]
QPTSVTQYGEDGVSSLPPDKIENNTPHKGFDSATSWNTPGNQWIRKTQDDSDMIADTFDANGDGFPDYVKSKVDGSGKSYWKIYLSTKSGFQNSYQKWRPYWRNIRDIRHSEPEEGDNTRSAPIDFNRDGYIDAAQANSSSELGITWNTGSGYTGVTWWKLPVDNAWIRKVRKPGSDLSDPHAPNLEQAFMDMNGDGLPDIVRKNNNRWEIWRNTGKCIDNPDDPYCFEDFGTWKVYHPDAWLEEVEKDDSDVRVTTYDMNGDGLTDIIWGDN